MSCTDPNCGGPVPHEVIDQFVDRGHWVVVHVNDELPYVYTIGMHKLGRPEFFFSGPFSGEVIMLVTNEVCGHLLEHNMRKYTPMKSYDDIMTVPTMFLDVPKENYIGLMDQAINYHKEDFLVQQIVWSDRKGLFPWDKDSEFMFNREFDGKQDIIGVMVN